MVALLKAKPCQGLADSGSVSIAAHQVKAMLQIAVTPEDVRVAVGILHGKLELFELITHAQQLLKSDQTAAPERAVGLVDSNLGEVTHAQAFGTEDRAFAGLVFACQDAQQGGFANPVGANDGNASVVRNGKRDPIKNVNGTKRACQILRGQQCHNGKSIPASGRYGRK